LILIIFNARSFHCVYLVMECFLTLLL
jgi:hypothetical protein